MHPFEELFNLYGPLCARIERLKYIVQNPVEIPSDLLREWEQMFYEAQTDLASLGMATHDAVVAFKTPDSLSDLEPDMQDAFQKLQAERREKHKQ